MNVDEYAQVAQVSPRRVRALIEKGSVKAEKAGRGWQITEPVRRPHTRRPLSPESRKALGRALSSRSLAGLSGQLRARTASRIRTLRESSQPAILIADWWGGREPEVIDVMTSWVARAVRGDNEFLLERIHAHRSEYLRSRKDLAEIVSSERVIQGVSRAALAERSKVDTDFVAALEHAKPITSIGALRRVLRILNVQPSALPNIEVR